MPWQAELIDPPIQILELGKTLWVRDDSTGINFKCPAGEKADLWLGLRSSKEKNPLTPFMQRAGYLVRSLENDGMCRMCPVLQDYLRRDPSDLSPCYTPSIDYRRLEVNVHDTPANAMMEMCSLSDSSTFQLEFIPFDQVDKGKRYPQQVDIRYVP